MTHKQKYYVYYPTTRIKLNGTQLKFPYISPLVDVKVFLSGYVVISYKKDAPLTNEKNDNYDFSELEDHLENLVRGFPIAIDTLLLQNDVYKNEYSKICTDYLHTSTIGNKDTSLSLEADNHFTIWRIDEKTEKTIAWNLFKYLRYIEANLKQFPSFPTNIELYIELYKAFEEWKKKQ